MAEEFYQLPESPVYNAETIRKIQDTDPVRASTIVNPVISRLIENTHAVKKLADKAQQEAASAAAAEEYSSESVYNAGSYCTRGGKLYKANQDILSAEPWTEAHWTETNIAAELVAIYTALSNKAPGGFGLGTNSKLIEDYNQALTNGWYFNILTGDSVHAPDRGQWWCHVTTFATDVIRQDFYAIAPSNGKGRHVIRWHHSIYYDGWSDFEWVTPPMMLGVEYRTAEKWKGNSVYVMAVSGGAYPDNASKQLTIQIPNYIGPVRMIEASGVLDVAGSQVPGVFGGDANLSDESYLGMFIRNSEVGAFIVTVASKRNVGQTFTLKLKYWKPEE